MYAQKTNSADFTKGNQANWFLKLSKSEFKLAGHRLFRKFDFQASLVFPPLIN